MDDARFDTFSRGLAKAVDRRDLMLRLSAVSAAIATGLAVPFQEAEAGKKQRKRRRRCRKKKNHKLCGKQCVRGTCCPGQACGGGICVCVRAIEGDAFCAASLPDECEPTCVSSDNCGNSRRCVLLTEGCTNCLLECGA